MKIEDYDAITFDFYGTIVNWEPEVLAFLRQWIGPDQGGLSDSELLSLYDRLRQPIQEERPAWRYPEVLRRTLDALAKELSCHLPVELRDEFGEIAATHQPFGDSVAAVMNLRQRGLTVGVLSNVDEASLSRNLDRMGLDFDVVVTAERVGAYKPDLAHFWAALADLRALGIERHQVLHVAQSRYADIAPANRLDLDCVWVDRPGHIFGRRGMTSVNAEPLATVSSLEALLLL